MIRSFRDAGTEDVFNGRSTKAARKGCSSKIWKIAARKLDLLDSAGVLADLRIPPGNRLEVLRSERKGQHSLRINQQYRTCFTWTAQGPDEVEITDYH
jgi:proteic killer suppression protein